MHAILQAARSLQDRFLPLNQGSYKPLRESIPEQDERAHRKVLYPIADPHRTRGLALDDSELQVVALL